MDESNVVSGLSHAIELLSQCSTQSGFIASPTDKDNYKRVWGRDGIILGLAGLTTKRDDFKKTFLQTLRTLKQNQGPHGEIPSNVDVSSGRISYGGTAGRVDADLWFIIGCCAYWNATKDEHFLDEFSDSMEKVLFLLGAWEFNTRGLLYIPHTGDWSDEYLQEGYVLYDQLLYYRVLKDMASMYCETHNDKNLELEEKVGRLRNLIIENYWFDSCDEDSPYIYHPILYRKGCEAANKAEEYWMAFFSPAGYGYRFDSFANILASLFDIADDDKRKSVDSFIDTNIVRKDTMLLPAFHPVVTPEDTDWESMQISFSYTFKNKPYEFHNGGLWPMLTGFYVLDLAKRGKTDLAKKYVKGIDKANEIDTEGEGWGFYEFINGKTHKPGGTRRQGWSAAGSIIAHAALEGNFAL